MNTYSFSQVYVAIAGKIITGLDGLTITYTSPSFITIKGIRGNHTRRRTDDTSAIVELRVLQTSYANDLLSSFQEDDYINNNGRLSITVKDLLGRTVFDSNTAFVTGIPVATYEDEIGERVWQIQCLRSNFYLGSNIVKDAATKTQSSQSDGVSLSDIGQIARDVTRVGSFAKRIKNLF